MVARPSLRFVLWLPLIATGCQSPYATDQGALAGGVGGAGLGALIGQAAGGHPIAGALIGAGAGTVTGAAIGAGVDNRNARNQAVAYAAQQRAQAVTVNDVLTMTRSHVDEQLILNQIQTHGVAAPVQSGELIAMQQEGVSTRVIAAMQSAPPAMAVASPPVIGPYYYPPLPPYGAYPSPGWGIWAR